MYERFSDTARKVMQAANAAAIGLHHEYIGTEHILLGLVRVPAYGDPNLITALGLKPEEVEAKVRERIQVGPETITSMGKLPQTPRAKKVIEYAIEEARNLNHNYVGCEHLVLGCLREPEGIAGMVFSDFGVKIEEARDCLCQLLGQQNPATKAGIDYSKLTDRSRKVCQLANQEAQRFNHSEVEPEHIMLGLIKEGSGVACNVLKNLNLDLRKVREQYEKLVKPGPDMIQMGKLPLTKRTELVLNQAMVEAEKLGHSYVGTEHILLGLCVEQDTLEEPRRIFSQLGINTQQVREETTRILGVEGEKVDGKEEAVEHVPLVGEWVVQVAYSNKDIKGTSTKAQLKASADLVHVLHLIHSNLADPVAAMLLLKSYLKDK